jgi:septum formation protein
MTKIILATSSPFRIRAFKHLNIDFIAENSNIDEYFEGRPTDPKKLVRALAKLKAKTVAKKYKNGIIIGLDSIGLYNNKILEKPNSRKESFARLKKLSGKSHYFYTGIYMENLKTGKNITELCETKAFLRKISDSEINKYLKEDLEKVNQKCCIVYDPEFQYSTSFVETIEGSYNNLIRGIPLEIIIKMLKKIGYVF